MDGRLISARRHYTLGKLATALALLIALHLLPHGASHGLGAVAAAAETARASHHDHAAAPRHGTASALISAPGGHDVCAIGDAHPRPSPVLTSAPGSDAAAPPAWTTIAALQPVGSDTLAPRSGPQRQALLQRFTL